MPTSQKLAPVPCQAQVEEGVIGMGPCHAAQELLPCHCSLHKKLRSVTANLVGTKQ